jgi:hypothetical protein
MRFLLPILFLLICVTTGVAQPTIPDDPPSAEPVPISGIEILLLAGAAFGVKKLRAATKHRH